MTYLGNPQDTLRVIHVAGTSGKTSTVYYSAALLHAAGYKVGLTVSPHVDEINERVQVDMTPLEEATFCAALGEFLEIVETSEYRLSYFEVMVAFAYWYFARVKVDYAVIEVGLGGLIDGTNVISRADKVCAITDIGLDHTKILGSTLSEIATQKAGIMLAGNHVFTHAQAPEIIDVFRATAAARGATLHVITGDRSVPTVLPRFQQRNLQLAIAAVEGIGVPVGEAEIQRAAQAYVPARMETLQWRGKMVIIDGAHNGQKLAVLLEAIQAKYPHQSIAALVAFVAGDEQRMHDGLEQLVSRVDSIIATEFKSNQDLPKHSVGADDIISWCGEHDFTEAVVVKDPLQAFEALVKRPEDILLVTGSFYLLNHIRPHIMKS